MKKLLAALSSAVFLLGIVSAHAQSTKEAPAGSGQRYQGVLLIDPTTGQPYSATGGGGGGSGTITSPVGSNTKAQSVSVTYATDQLLPAFAATPTVLLGAGSAAIGSITNTAFAISGTLPAFAATPTFNLGTLNGAALDTSVQAVKTALGSPFQAGGSIGNTGFNALQAGANTSLTNPLFVQLSQSGAALSGTNLLPVGDINVAQTVKAPGAAASFAISVQGVPSGLALAASEADGANVTIGAKADAAYTGSGSASLVAALKGIYTALLAPTPAGTNSIGSVGLNAGANLVGKVGIDQTTPGATNGVVVNSGAVTNSPSTGATLTTSQPSVTTTAAALTFSGTIHREIYNPAAATASIFIGASGVTTSTGWEIPPGTSYDVSRFSGSVFAIAASSQTVRLISY